MRLPRAAVVWLDGEHLRLAEVPERTTTVFGRDEDAAIRLSHPTVSKRHAILRSEGRAFVIENRSGVNPTAVNGVPIHRPTPLSDRDAIRMGAVQLVFHDLAAADRFSRRLVCSYCGRQQRGTEKECWFCGTSLANAPTGTVERHEVGCRIVSAIGEWYDLYPGDILIIHRRGGAEVRQGAALPADSAAAVELRDDRPVLPSPSGDALTVNGRPPAEGQPLQTGDELSAGAAHFVVIVR